MISYAESKEPARVLWNAVMDDKSPISSGSWVEYYRGETNVEPKGKRAEVFSIARSLKDKGRLLLFQKRLGDGMYSYRGFVK